MDDDWGSPEETVPENSPDRSVSVLLQVLLASLTPALQLLEIFQENRGGSKPWGTTIFDPSQAFEYCDLLGFCGTPPSGDETPHLENSLLFLGQFKTTPKQKEIYGI